MGEGKTRGRARLPATPDAVDVAMDAVGDDDLARKLLARHTELIDAQIHSERLEHGAKRMVIFFRAVLGLAALTLLLALVWMVARARADHGLVIEALSVPPDLAQRGLTGEALAANLADQLGHIDQVAQSFRSAETMKVNWGDDIKIVIPSTGVSIGELDTFLRRQLGGQTNIGGSVFRTPAGLRLTVRAGADGTVEQLGDDAQLEAMVKRAAEGVFEKTQPYRYSKYLEFTGRQAEAMAVARRLADTSDDPKERAWAWAQISNLLLAIDPKQAVLAGKRAIREDPGNALAYLNVNIALSQLGHYGEARAFARKANALGVRGEGGLSEVGVNTSRGNLAAQPGYRGDFVTALRNLDALSGKQYPGIEQIVRSNRAEMLLGLHDVRDSRITTDVPSDDYFAANFRNNGGLSAPHYSAAAVLDDWPAAAALARQQIAALDRQAEGPSLATIGRERHALPRLAVALVLSGHGEQAKAIVASLPLDCAPCLSSRALVAGATGDLAGARLWTIRAERMNPGQPFYFQQLSRIYYRARLYPQALAVAAEAVARGPRFADALKVRGDALRRLGRRDEAVGDYAAAAQLAPRWGRLQIDWAIAELGRGKRAAARNHLAAARTMDLGTSDRRMLAELTALVSRGT